MEQIQTGCEHRMDEVALLSQAMHYIDGLGLDWESKDNFETYILVEQMDLQRKDRDNGIPSIKMI